MDWNDLSELREAANSYLSLLQHHEFGYRDLVSVTRLHRAIDNVDLGEIGSVLAKFDVHRTAIIHDGIEPIMKIIGDLEKEIGDNMPKIIKGIDPDVAAVFKFCKDVSNVLSGECEKLKSRIKTDPTADDVNAVEKLRLYGMGYYDDLAFDDFIKEYIIKDLSHIAQFRRLNYMISQCAGEQEKRDLSKFLYWRKCDEDAIKELHDAFVGFYRWYDYVAGVSPIPSEFSCDEVTTRLFSVMEWCKEFDSEFKIRLANCPLLKDIEDLRALATHICESADNLGWLSIIGNDVMTLELINDVAYMLDNEIVPAIKQRNGNASERPEPQPSPTSGNADDVTPPDTSTIMELMLLKDIEQKQRLLDVLHRLIDGKKGKDVALVFLVCVNCGLMSKPTHHVLRSTFVNIGAKSGYNTYYSKGLEYYSPEEIKGVETHILPFVNGL